MIKESKWLTSNLSYINAKPLTPTGIVVHSTGTNQKKLSAYWGQFNRAALKSSVHGAIGLNKQGELVYQQWLPYNIQCWGCGSGRFGSYNNSHIQFEICEDINDKEWTLKTYQYALEICKELMDKYNIPAENVVCHSEAHSKGYASNHADVMHWWAKYGLSMDKFRLELDDNMTQEQFNQMFNIAMTAYRKSLQDNDAGTWSIDERKWAVKEKLILGSGLLPNGQTNFQWQDFITREQLAAILFRYDTYTK